MNLIDLEQVTDIGDGLIKSKLPLENMHSRNEKYCKLHMRDL